MLVSPNNTHIPSKEICRPLAQASGDLDRVIRIESERKTLCDTAPSRGRMFAWKGVAVTPQFPVFLFRKVQVWARVKPGTQC